jgi:NADH-quinone oxidoreductase subunit C
MELAAIRDYLNDRLGSDLLSAKIAHGELTLTVRREAIVQTLAFLRDDPQTQMQMLADLCGADYPTRADRFEVVYNLLSVTKNFRLRVVTATDESTPVPSVVGIYPAAGWYEREAWDLYGILFAGNADLRRLLTDYGFQGHPLRKDFPLTGFVELRYDNEQKRVVYDAVKLPQDFRNFDYLSPWEGMDKLLPGDEKASVVHQPIGSVNKKRAGG